MEKTLSSFSIRANKENKIEQIILKKFKKNILDEVYDFHSFQTYLASITNQNESNQI
jgi:hypothetical protein